MDVLRKRAGWVTMGLAALWLAVQAGLFFYGPRTGISTPHFGVRYGNDSKRFFEAAERILAGRLPSGKQLRYLGYDYFVAFFLWSGLGTLGIVIFQSLVTSAAAYCLYRLARRMYDHPTGLLAALLYIGYVEVHFWNFYVLTESLFVSMVIISLFLAVEARGWWQKALAGALIIFTCTIRPNGFILAGSIAIYAICSLWRARRYKALAGVACLVLLAAPLGFKTVNAMWVHSHPVRNLSLGTVISSYEPIRLTMPGTLPPDLLGNENPALDVLSFIAAKPGYVLRLAGARLRYFVIHTRPYYSDFHNAFVLSTLLPLYALAAWGLSRPTAYWEEKAFLVSMAFLQALTVALHSASWDGRHLLVVLPVVFLFAARGLVSLSDAARALGRPSRRRER